MKELASSDLDSYQYQDEWIEKGWVDEKGSKFLESSEEGENDEYS